MVQARFVTSVPVGNILGEGVCWHADSQTVWWTDIEARTLYAYHLKDESLSRWDLPDRLGCFAFTADPDVLIAAFAPGFARYRLSTGALDWLHRPEDDKARTRFNDGRVDAAGRFWAGSMVEGDRRNVADEDCGALYRLDTDGGCTRLFGGVLIANGLCWSPDGTRLYFADSPRHEIYRFDVDPTDSTVSNKRVFARTEPGIHPDGAVTDAHGCLWSAHWGAGCVVRYNPDGAVDHVLELPVSQPTCPAFGGPDGRHLFITTARADLSQTELERQPLAGDLLIYHTDVAGPPATLWGG